MIEVELPDGSVAEFPDGTSPEQIQTILAQQFPRTSAAAVPAIPEPMGIPAPAAGPATAARTAGEQALLTAGDVARSYASGGTMGTSDELVARINELRGKGTYEQNLARERGKLAAVSPWIRVPGEAAGMMAATALVPGAMGPGVLRGAATGAAGGGLFGFGSGEGGLEERAKSAGFGAAAGGAGGAVGGLLSNLISPPASRSPALQALMREGITPTPGQVAGQGGMVGKTAQQVEEALTSVPLINQAVRAGKTRGMEEFNEAAINRAMAPTGKTASKIGYEGIKEANAAISKTWDDTLKGITVQWDDTLGQQVADVLADAQRSLTKRAYKKLMSEVSDLASQETMESTSTTGRHAYTIVDNLGKKAAEFQGSEKIYDKRLGAALGELREVFIDQIMRSAPPEKAAKLTELRKAYPEYLLIERAAGMKGAREGVFSPAQYNAAARALEPTKRKSYWARGQARGQDLARAATEVMGQNLPNSGTTDRAIIAALLGGPAVGATVDPLAGAAVTGGLLAGSLPYTPLLQRALAAGMATRPAGAPAAARAAERLGLGLGFGGASYTGS